MLKRFGIALACRLLRQSLTLQERTKLTGAILEGLDAVPLVEALKIDGTQVTAQGRMLDYAKTAQLRASARAMLNNDAHALVREQVLVMAGTRAVIEGDTPEKLYFYRAAIWMLLYYEQLYHDLANVPVEE